MYLTGLDLNIANLYPPIEYPVSRGTYGLADLVHWEHSETWRTGLEDKLNYLVSVKDIQVTLNSEEFRDCIGHSIDERLILPVSSYLVSKYFLKRHSKAETYLSDGDHKNFKYKHSKRSI